jgi:5-methyltetrahydrofolate--homocysteine methyltransferase
MAHRLTELVNDKTVIFDGGLGSMLIAAGLPAGQSPEAWNLERPDAVAEVHRQYYAAGADVVHTNSFGANPIKLADRGLQDRAEAINRRAADIVRSVCPAGCLVAGDIGPTGKMLQPFGDLEPQAAEAAFRRQAEALLSGGADLISIETMFSLEEALLALRAAKSLGAVYVVVSLTYNRNPRGFFTMMGDGVAKAVQAFEEAGADAIGSNCSLGSADMVDLTATLRAATRRPILIQPNAGQPVADGDRTVYRQTAAAFAADGVRIKAAGADMLGGCCGTTPEFIHALAQALTWRVLPA